MTMSVLFRRTLRLLCRPALHMTARTSLRHLTVALLVLVLMSPSTVQAYGVCRNTFRCLNGGEERYGQSIFGPCRCLCPHGYTGPRCQYRLLTRKRSFNMLADFLQDSLRSQQNVAEEADMNYGLQLDDQHMQRQRRRVLLHPRFFFRR